MELWSLLALAVTVGLFVIVYVAGRLGASFTVRTFAGLGLGVLVGVVFSDHVEYIAPLGRVYLNVLLAIVAPLVVVSILASITSLGSSRQLRSIGARSVGWLLGLNVVAIVLTLGLALAVGLGRGADLETVGIDTRSLDAIKKPFTEVFIGFFPTNVVNDFGENNIIPIILFSVLVAVAYSQVAERHPAQVAPFKALIDAARPIIFKVVGYVIALTPYAVLALTAVATSTAAGETTVLWSLFGVLAITYVACFLLTYVVGGVVLRTVADVKPIAWFRKFAPAQITAATTQSSAGTLPVTTSLLTQRIGVPVDIAGFTAPLGTTIGMPGCAGVWPIVLAIFAINGLGIDYSVADYAVLILLGAIVSIGTAGVPGTATITATTVLTAAGLPVEVVILTLPISAIADMARTLTNVTTAGIVSTVVARKEGRLDDAIFDAPDPDELVEPADPDDLPGPPAPVLGLEHSNGHTNGNGHSNGSSAQTNGHVHAPDHHTTTERKVP